MKLYSTNSPDKFVNLQEAVLKGLPDDNGLFMPDSIPTLSADFIQNLKNKSFQEISYIVAKTLLANAIPEEDLLHIINNSITFPAPIVQLSSSEYILELFHGPSLAFKDFGARFMAQLMSYFNKGEDKELVILVATSGDTGGAVAAGFYNTPGIKVVILYPSGKVSPLQEKQLTTLGSNITALEVEGTFDDCQALVKQAFLDKDLNKRIRLSSANSINIARLIPQSFYYFEAFKQIESKLPIVFSVPSGNFGNLSAGLIAKKMGLPIHQFIAATNINKVVPHYLATSEYIPLASKATLSNAMDVGNPSNFVRMLDLFSKKHALKKKECSTWNIIKEEILGFSFNDEQTKRAMKNVYKEYNYILDPHGAVGHLALKAYQDINPSTIGIVLETAHPSKFIEDTESILGVKVDIPERLAVLVNKKKVAIPLNIEFNSFKEYLLSSF